METQTLDFSHVDSLQKAEELFRAGKLERLYVFPLEFGGQEIPQNILYVPHGIAALKARLDGTIAKMVSDGNINSYRAEPEYQGDSFIPSKIKIFAAHNEKPGAFNPTINIW